MHRSVQRWPMIVTVCLLITACTPTLNWRAVRLDALSAWLPCKPDQATRPFLLEGATLSIGMQGCEAGGGVFAISRTPVPNTLSAAGVIGPWKQSTLRALANAEVKALAFKPPSNASMESTALQAVGRGPDGRPLEAQLVWFVAGNVVYHLAVYAEALTPAMTDPFFNELRLQ